MKNNNSGITLIEVRNEAMATIEALKAKQMDVKTASEIRSLLGVIVDTAKAQVAFINAIPNSIKEKMNEDNIKAIAGTLKDRDAELDESLNYINTNQEYKK